MKQQLEEIDDPNYTPEQNDDDDEDDSILDNAQFRQQKYKIGS